MTKSNSRLIWIDLEMTGLDHKNDKILEIASIITDGDLNIIEEGPNLIINQPNKALKKMGTWCTEKHYKTGLYKAVQKSTTTLEQAEKQTLNFLKRHTKKGASPLCGNTVWCDKLFLQKDMPEIYNFLHYRIVDVTAFKIMLNIWNKTEELFKKKNNHRALDDIKESIAELKFYKENYIKIKD